ncbi:MAG: carbohydrate kinase [Lepagella sp.]
MNDNRNIVVGMGEALWDCLPEGRKIGGAPANFAYHVSQFGIDSRVVSAVGNDDLGSEILDTFNSMGLNTDHIKTVDFPTGTVDVTLDEKRVPHYNIVQDVAWDNIPCTPDLMELASRTRAVCFGSLAQRSEVSRRTILSFLDAVPDTPDSYKVFDINLRQSFFTPDVLKESISRCNVLKINDEELGLVSQMFGYPGIDFKDQCWIILGKYALKLLILTCGTDGSYVFTPGKVSFLPTPIVEVADTVGAGDSFTGAFLASLLHGKSVEEAHRLAVDTSAFVCTCNGAMPKLPDTLTSQCK